MIYELIIGCSEKTHENENTVPYNPEIETSQVAIGELEDMINKLWTVGYAQKDTLLVSKLYHSKFHLVDDEGTLFTKEAELSYIAEYGNQYENFSYTIQNTTFFGNRMAVVLSRCRFQGIDAGGQVFSTEYLQSLTFAKFSDGWKIIYSQVSGVNESTMKTPS